MMREKEKIIIFGAGYFGEIAAMTMGYEKEILFFVDNDEKKWEKTKLGFSIKPVSEAMLFGKEKVRVVIAMADYRAAVLQLEAMGVHNYVYFEDVYGDDFSCKSRDIMDREIPDTEDQIYRKYVKNAWMNHVTQHYDGEKRITSLPMGNAWMLVVVVESNYFTGYAEGMTPMELTAVSGRWNFAFKRLRIFLFQKHGKIILYLEKGRSFRLKITNLMLLQAGRYWNMWMIGKRAFRKCFASQNQEVFYLSMPRIIEIHMKSITGWILESRW